MSRIEDLAGTYEGLQQIRPGREGDLSPMDRKRHAKSNEPQKLELLPNGQFVFKEATVGRYRLERSILFFEPQRFQGKTLAEMKAHCERSGHAFRLGFLFDPFQLQIEEEALVSTDPRSVIFTVYRRI